MDRTMYDVPSPIIAALLLAAMLVAVGIGRYVGKRRSQKEVPKAKVRPTRFKVL